MYKTVRHGENSLQYTILPQQDVDSSGNHSRVRKSRRSRTTTVVVVILVLGSAVVAASIVLPLLVSADIIRVPESLRKFAPFSVPRHEQQQQQQLQLQREDAFQRLSARRKHGDDNTTTTTPQPTTAASDLTTSEDNLNTLTTLPVAGGNRTDAADDGVVVADARAASTATPRGPPPHPTATFQVTADPQPATSVATMSEPEDASEARWDPKTSYPASNGSSSTRIFAEAMVPEPGVVGGRTTPNSSTAAAASTTTTTADPNVHRIVRPTGDPKRRNMYQPRWQPRWPFADPSAYFQWTGYAGRDSLILPMILGAVTLLLLLAVCACYAVKRRRQKTLRRKTIGKISSDLQSGDKATLLPDGSEEE